MTPAELVKRLLAEQDLKYRDFHASLLPNIDKKKIIGVRVPTMRKIAKEFAANTLPKDIANFLDKLPHKYFEENQVHLFVVERIKDFDECLRRIEQFLPYIDNWAVCDGKSPKALLKDETRF
jgi:DNA alkylation repair enzyme.